MKLIARSIFLAALLFSFSISEAQFLDAIKDSDTVKFTKILAKSDIEKINEIGKKDKYTPLTYALLKENSLFAKMLIDKGANVSLHDGYDYSPIFLAVKNKDKVLTEIMLNKGADVNTINKYDVTPLHVAAKNCDTAIISLLILHKANVNAVDYYGKTPLTESMYEDQPAISDSVLYKLIGDYYILSDNKPTGQIEIHDTLVKHFETLNIKLSGKDGKKYLDESTIYEMFVPATCQLLAAGAKVCPEKGAKNPLTSIYGTKHILHKMLLYRYSDECSPEDSIVKRAIESSLEHTDPFFPGLMLKIVDSSVVQSLNQEIVIKTILDNITKMANKNKYSSYSYSSNLNSDYDPILCREYYAVLCKLFSMGLKDKNAQVMEWGSVAINACYDAIFINEIYELMLLSAKSGSNPNLILDTIYFKTPLILWLTHRYGYSRLDKSSHYDLIIIKIIKTIIENGASLDPKYTGNDSHFSNDWSPLSHAMGDDSEELIRLYLSKGARMDVQPVKSAFNYAPDNIKQILLDAGFKP